MAKDMQVLDLMLRGKALDICRSAVEWFGKDSQERQATEEMGELIAALNHIKRGKCTKDDVQSEIADVLIMCNQLAEIYGRQDVEYHIEKKLQRLQQRCTDAAWQYHDKREAEIKGHNIYTREVC